MQVRSPPTSSRGTLGCRSCMLSQADRCSPLGTLPLGSLRLWSTLAQDVAIVEQQAWSLRGLPHLPGRARTQTEAHCPPPAQDPGSRPSHRRHQFGCCLSGKVLPCIGHSRGGPGVDILKSTALVARCFGLLRRSPDARGLRIGEADHPGPPSKGPPAETRELTGLLWGSTTLAATTLERYARALLFFPIVLASRFSCTLDAVISRGESALFTSAANYLEDAFRLSWFRRSRAGTFCSALRQVVLLAVSTGRLPVTALGGLSLLWKQVTRWRKVDPGVFRRPVPLRLL